MKNKRMNKLNLYLSCVEERLLFPRFFSDDLRAPAVRGPVSDVGFGAAGFGFSTVPAETTVLTAATSTTAFFFLFAGAGYT